MANLISQGEHIIGHKVQRDKNHLYQPGDCACFHCSAFGAPTSCHETDGITDWGAKTDRCCGGFCTDQRQCAHPSKQECVIGDNTRGQNPLLYYGWNKNAPNLKCMFDLNKIDKYSQVQAYQEKFGQDNDITAKFCTQKVKTCQGMKECSRLKSTQADGVMCRKWFEKQPNNVQNSTIQNYCLAHNTDDCKCANRSINTTYKALKEAKLFNDGCWYVPCANPSKFLVPTQLRNPDNCPSHMCQVIYDIIQNDAIEINNVKNDIKCDFSKIETSGREKGGPVENPKIPKIIPSKIIPSKIISKNSILIPFILILIFILIKF